MTPVRFRFTTPAPGMAAADWVPVDGVMLAELMKARDRHGDALTWLGRYLTR